jgi:hypothetical protein
MRVFVFLTYLYFLLLAGYHYFHTGYHDNRICYTYSQSQPQKNIDTDHRLKFTNTPQDYTLIEDETPDDAEESLLSDNVEDEETNMAARKYKVLMRRYLTYSDTFTLSNHRGSFRDQSPLLSHLPNKYITQRALRI